MMKLFRLWYESAAHLLHEADPQRRYSDLAITTTVLVIKAYSGSTVRGLQGFY